ncbi:MAG TPA: DUF2505 domain-containing protein [Acidimicrobiales bacterium]|nr:DUF2505 domain-containing protein [Acidimicrobiales bacterium]
MKFTVEHTYDHPADVVFAVLTDCEAVRAKYEAIGQHDIELVQRDEGDDGSVTLVTRRVVPLDVPGFAKKVLSPSQTVTQTDEWGAPDASGTRAGTFTVESKGTPVRVSGTVRLRPDGPDACRNVSEVDIQCKVPLIGGRIADFVSKDARAAVDHEQTWIREHLAGS